MFPVKIRLTPTVTSLCVIVGLGLYSYISGYSDLSCFCPKLHNMQEEQHQILLLYSKRNRTHTHTHSHVPIFLVELNVAVCVCVILFKQTLVLIMCSWLFHRSAKET